MLPLWRKELRVVLCPDKVIVVAMTSGLRRKLVSQAILPVISDNTADWHPAIDTLDRWLAENDQGKAEVRILLSSCFVRFAMIPFSENVNNYAERLTVAGLLFESVYGESAKQWKLTLDKEEYDEPCLAAAIDVELLDALNQTISSRQLKTLSLLPYVASAFSAFNKQIRVDDGLFVVLDHGQAVLFVIKEGKVVGVRKTLLGTNYGERDVVSLLQREMLISGLGVEGGTCYIHTIGRLNYEFPSISGLKVIALRNESKCDAYFDVDFVED